MIENPQPAWLSLLLLALPGIAFAAFALNQAIFPPHHRSLCTVPAIGIVLALLPTHLLALVFGSLTIGLAAAWSLVGLAGYAWIYRYWRDFTAATAAQYPGGARRIGIAILATLPIVLPTILLNFYDEVNSQAHQGIIASLQNGAYPPRYLYEPSLPLRYHYAFDLAGAIITGFARVRVDHAIDLLTLALWPCTFLLFWRLGEHIGGERAGLPVALAVCFSGGWPVFSQTEAACTGPCTVNGLRVIIPFSMYFFQHPWSIAVPLFCLVVLQCAALPKAGNQLLAVTGLVCSLTLLSLSQAVLFGTTVIAMGLAELWRFARHREKRAAIVLFSLGLSFLGAKSIGGFFVSAPYPPAGGIFDTGFDVRDYSGPYAVLGQIQWNVASFGLLFPLGIAGLLRARREKVFLITLTFLILIIVNTLRYRYTSEINKFAGVGLVVLGIGAGIALYDFGSRAASSARRLICGLLVVGLVVEGVSFPFIRLLTFEVRDRAPFSDQMIRPYFSGTYPVDDDDARAVSFLRTQMFPSELVYRAQAKSEPYAIWGGLPTQIGWFLYAAEREPDDVYGLGAVKFAARKNLANLSEDWFDRLAAAHVTWVVADAEDTVVNAALDSPQGRRRLVLAAQYGDVRVFHFR